VIQPIAGTRRTAPRAHHPTWPDTGPLTKPSNPGGANEQGGTESGRAVKPVPGRAAGPHTEPEQGPTGPPSRRNPRTRPTTLTLAEPDAPADAPYPARPGAGTYEVHNDEDEDIRAGRRHTRATGRRETGRWDGGRVRRNTRSPSPGEGPSGTEPRAGSTGATAEPVFVGGDWPLAGAGRRRRTRPAPRRDCRGKAERPAARWVEDPARCAQQAGGQRAGGAHRGDRPGRRTMARARMAGGPGRRPQKETGWRRDLFRLNSGLGLINVAGVERRSRCGPPRGLTNRQQPARWTACYKIAMREAFKGGVGQDQR